LLENTIKYSSDGRAALDLIIAKETNGRKLVKIEYTNRATMERLSEVCRRIDDLKNLSDPMQTYITMMEETAARDDGSGLGLIRIRVEGRMELTYSVRDDMITITASTSVYDCERAQ
jgi:hypothetical protein